MEDYNLTYVFTYNCYDCRKRCKLEVDTLSEFKYKAICCHCGVEHEITVVGDGLTFENWTIIG